MITRSGSYEPSTPLARNQGSIANPKPGPDIAAGLPLNAETAGSARIPWMSCLPPGSGGPLLQPLEPDTQLSRESLDCFAAQNPHARLPLPARAPVLIFGQWDGQGGGFVLVILGRHVCV